MPLTKFEMNQPNKNTIVIQDPRDWQKSTPMKIRDAINKVNDHIANKVNSPVNSPRYSIGSDVNEAVKQA